MAPITVDAASRDPTLHLPRILCLHGGGTNAGIFQMQCRVIASRLRTRFRLIFAQAPFPACPGPDVTSVYSSHGPFRAWLRQEDGLLKTQNGHDAHEAQGRQGPESDSDSEVDAEELQGLGRAAPGTEAAMRIRRALSDAIDNDNLRGATGDVVGLLGFSQGAKIAASLLHAQQVCQRRLGPDVLVWPDFRFAVLLAGRGPLIWLMPETMAPPPGFVDAAEMSPFAPAVRNSYAGLMEDSDDVYYADKLKLPTVHVHGLNDPNLHLHRQMCLQYCQPGSAALVEWPGEHRVPIKTADVGLVVKHIFRVAESTGIPTRGQDIE